MSGILEKLKNNYKSKQKINELEKLIIVQLEIFTEMQSGDNYDKTSVFADNIIEQLKIIESINALKQFDIPKPKDNVLKQFDIPKSKDNVLKRSDIPKSKDTNATQTLFTPNTVPSNNTQSTVVKIFKPKKSSEIKTKTTNNIPPYTSKQSNTTSKIFEPKNKTNKIKTNNNPVANAALSRAQVSASKTMKQYNRTDAAMEYKKKRGQKNVSEAVYGGYN
jgi:hypothetical protein